jgi:hypothetical protein
MPQAVKVRKETVENQKHEKHEHIIGVITSDGIYHTNKEVVDGINAGEEWYTNVGGKKAKIRAIRFCPEASCLHQPYITTAPDSTTANNLDNLPLG